MSEATIRSTLKTAVSSVTNVINVHDYARWSSDVTELESQFLNINNTLFHGWIIELESALQNRVRTAVDTYKETTADADRLRDHNYVIRGYYGLDDSAATEKTFMVITEAVMNELDSNATLHATGSEVFRQVGAAELREYSHRLFAGKLCHYAELRITITSRKNG